MLQHNLAEQGRRHALAVEQPHAEFSLELFQAAGQRGLGHTELLGGEPEMATLRKGADDVNLPDGVHTHLVPQQFSVVIAAIASCSMMRKVMRPPGWA